MSDDVITAVDALLHQYESMISARVSACEAKLRGHMVDADDIRQLIRIKLWKSWPNARRPSAVLHRIVWSVCCDVIRSDKRGFETVPLTDEEEYVYIELDDTESIRAWLWNIVSASTTETPSLMLAADEHGFEWGAVLRAAYSLGLKPDECGVWSIHSAA